MPGTFFRPRPLAVVLASALLGAASGIQAGVIDSVDTANMEVLSGEGATLIYQDAADTVSNGYLIFDEGGAAPGIEVYQEAFNAGGASFAGCIMAKTDFDPDPNCLATFDSGKRVKMRATEAAPVDILFQVTDDATSKLYRVFGKLTNESEARFEGFRVELGFGLGDDFTASTELDGLELDTVSAFGRFPGGLFGGSPAEGLPFFNVDVASFDADLDPEDLFTTTVMPVQYTDLLGNWLPFRWVPTAWFHDFDGNPASDDELLAWFDGDQWLTYDKEFDETGISDVLDTYGAGPLVPGDDILERIENELDLTDSDIRDAVIATMTLVEREISQAELDAWAAQPVTVETNLGALYATWDPELDEEGLYVLEAGGTLTAAEMAAEIGASAGGLVRVDGYVRGPIEDLANVNFNYAIRVNSEAALDWETCDAGNCGFTMRITPLAAADADAPPPWATETDVRRSSSSGGCSIGGNSAGFDPLLPGLALLGLGYLGLRRRMGRAPR